MESCTRWLVAAISGVLVHCPRCGHGSSSFVSLDHHSRRHLDKEHSLESTLAALGAEDVATEVEAALERAREEKRAVQANQQARWSPDAVLEHAQCKVRRFEEALKAMGDMQGPEVEFLQHALKVHRAFRTSIGEDRCGTRSRAGSAHRGTLLFDPSRSPSRGVATRHPATTHSGCLRRVGRIEGEVGFHRVERDEALSAQVCKRQAMSRTSVVFADLSAWMDDRHAEFFATISTGDQVRTQRLTSMMAECAERLHQLTSARTS